MKNIKYAVIMLLAFFMTAQFVYSADELLSAKELLEKISANLKANIKDFEADYKWSQGDNVQDGKLYYKNPQRLRIDYTNPANQVFCTNGYDYWVYLPTYNYVLHQVLMVKERKSSESSQENLTDNKKDKKDKNKDNNKEKETSNPMMTNLLGLDNILATYSIEFNETKSAVDYKGTKAYKFKCIRWRSSRSGINVIYLTIQENGIQRKIEGITASYRKVTIELDNIKTNGDIPDLKFNYEPPAHARTMDNFITNQGEYK